MITDIQTGRSMLEMLGVLAIVGVLTVGGFSLVSKVNTSNQTNNVIDEVSSLAAKVRVIARDYGSGDGTFMKYVCKGKAYPDTLDCDLVEGTPEGDTCNCATFTGSADVSYTVENGSYPTLFTLTASNLSDEMCMSLLTTNWGSETTTGFMGVTGGSENTGDSTDPIAIAATACNDDSNSLTFSYR